MPGFYLDGIEMSEVQLYLERGVASSILVKGRKRNVIIGATRLTLLVV